MFGIGKKSSDRVVIVSRDEWEDLRADLRGLKRLAALEADERTAQNARFAQAIDTLDARSQELQTLIATTQDVLTRNAIEFSSRIDRIAASVGELQQGMETLVMANNATAQTLNTVVRADPVAMAERMAALNGIVFDLIETRASTTEGFAGVLDQFNERITAVQEAYGEMANRFDLTDNAIAATRGELNGRLDEHVLAIKRLQVDAVPTLADAIAAAPPPDIEEMRAFYAEKRAKAGHETTVLPERTPPVIVVTDDEPVGLDVAPEFSIANYDTSDAPIAENDAKPETAE